MVYTANWGIIWYRSHLWREPGNSIDIVTRLSLMIIWRFGRAVALADGIDSFEMLGVSVFLRGYGTRYRCTCKEQKTMEWKFETCEKILYFACIYHVLIVLKWRFTYIFGELWRYVLMYWGSFDTGLCIYFMMEITFHKLVYDMMSDSCRTFFLSFEDLPSENGYDIVLILKETLPTKCPDISFWKCV